MERLRDLGLFYILLAFLLAGLSYPYLSFWPGCVALFFLIGLSLNKRTYYVGILGLVALSQMLEYRIAGSDKKDLVSQLNLLDYVELHDHDKEYFLNDTSLDFKNVFFDDSESVISSETTCRVLYEPSFSSDSYYSNLFIYSDNSASIACDYADVKESPLAKGLTVEAFSLFEGLVLGDKANIPKEVSELFRRLGASHFLAISGMHLGFVMLFLNLIFFPLRAWRFKYVLFAVLSFIYLWEIDFPTSFLRAWLMFVLYALFRAFNLRSSGVKVVLMVATALLIYDPWLLFDVGFQMSFSAVFVIIYRWPSIQKRHVPVKYKGARILNFFIDTVSVSILAQIGVVFWSLYYFKSFAWGGLLSSLILTLPLTLLILGYYVLYLLSFFGIALEDVKVWFNIYVDYLLDLMHGLEGFSFYRSYSDLGWAVLVLLACLVLILVLFVKRMNFKKWRQLLFMGTIVSVCIVVWPKKSKPVFSISSDGLAFGNKEFRDTLFFNEELSYMRLQEAIWVSEPFQGSRFTIVHLRRSPKLHFLRLLEELKPDLVLIDSYNYRSMKSRWVKDLEAEAIDYLILKPRTVLKFDAEKNLLE
ncbi:MAG: ComEC/Rec2 family competence protein [Flavobacteriaceae bacterium]